MANGNEAPKYTWKSGQELSILSTSRYWTLQEKIERKKVFWRKTMLSRSLFKWRSFPSGIFKHLATINALRGEAELLFPQYTCMNWSKERSSSSYSKNHRWKLPYHGTQFWILLLEYAVGRDWLHRKCSLSTSNLKTIK